MTAKDWFLLIVSLIIWYFLDVDFLRQLLNEHQDQANSCISVKAWKLSHGIAFQNVEGKNNFETNIFKTL